MLDAASVIDHEARQVPLMQLFHEALLSYRDVFIVAVMVSLDRRWWAAFPLLCAQPRTSAAPPRPASAPPVH